MFHHLNLAFGSRAARFCLSAAYGGQIVLPVEMVRKVVAEWTQRPCPPMPENGKHVITVSFQTSQSIPNLIIEVVQNPSSSMQLISILQVQIPADSARSFLQNRVCQDNSILAMSTSQIFCHKRKNDVEFHTGEDFDTFEMSTPCIKM